MVDTAVNVFIVMANTAFSLVIILPITILSPMGLFPMGNKGHFPTGNQPHDQDLVLMAVGVLQNIARVLLCSSTSPSHPHKRSSTSSSLPFIWRTRHRQNKRFSSSSSLPFIWRTRHRQNKRSSPSSSLPFIWRTRHRTHRPETNRKGHIAGTSLLQPSTQTVCLEIHSISQLSFYDWWLATLDVQKQFLHLTGHIETVLTFKIKSIGHLKIKCLLSSFHIHFLYLLDGACFERASSFKHWQGDRMGCYCHGWLSWGKVTWTSYGKTLQGSTLQASFLKV